MKWIKTWSRSRTLEERFSDLAADRHILLREIRGRRDKPASLCKLQEGSFKLICLRDNYRCCTVLLVRLMIVSQIWQIYTSSIKLSKIYVFKHYPPNLPSPIPWPQDVCLELLYLQPPLWKNPGSAPALGVFKMALCIQNIQSWIQFKEFSCACEKFITFSQFARKTIAYSQTLYFLFEVRRACGIKNKNRGGFIDRQRKGVGLEEEENIFLSRASRLLMFSKRTERKMK